MNKLIIVDKQSNKIATARSVNYSARRRGLSDVWEIDGTLVFDGIDNIDALEQDFDIIMEAINESGKKAKKRLYGCSLSPLSLSDLQYDTKILENPYHFSVRDMSRWEEV